METAFKTTVSPYWQSTQDVACLANCPVSNARTESPIFFSTRIFTTIFPSKIYFRYDGPGLLDRFCQRSLDGEMANHSEQDNRRSTRREHVRERQKRDDKRDHTLASPTTNTFAPGEQNAKGFMWAKPHPTMKSPSVPTCEVINHSINKRQGLVHANQPKNQPTTFGYSTCQSNPNTAAGHACERNRAANVAC